MGKPSMLNNGTSNPYTCFVGKHTPITGSMGLARIRGLLGKQLVFALRSFPSKPSLQLSFLDVFLLYGLVREQDVVPSKPKRNMEKNSTVKNHHETMEP